MEAGCAGAAPVPIDKVVARLVPQVLIAATEITPPAAPVVTVMLLLVDDPLHPTGSIHAYEVAPLTGDTEYV